jgi:colanic acid/amylovoran biosynthesis glycosyltransferase
VKQTVVYVSTCAADREGRPGPFLMQELPWMRAHFDRVVVCGRYGIAEITEERPKRIAAVRPAFTVIRALLSSPFQKLLWQELRHLHTDGKLTVINALKAWLFLVRGRKLRYWIGSALRSDETTTLYAYWMSYDGFASALCKRDHPDMRAVVRAHAFDIDVKRNPMNSYLMKRFMAETLDRICPISEAARTQLAAYVQIPADKLLVLNVGSAGERAEQPLRAPRFQNGVFHVVSCSSMVKIKRIPLMIDALAGWNKGKLHWLHIGGGPDEMKIRAYAKEMLGKNPSITYELTGGLPPEKVQGIYAATAFDTFLNTSANEGTPVSIMEALHAGIPVVAPNVGGIPELVDESVGCLYAQDGGAAEILRALETVYGKTQEKAERMSAAAQARWNERCLISNLLPKLFPGQAKERAGA